MGEKPHPRQVTEYEEERKTDREREREETAKRRRWKQTETVGTETDQEGRERMEFDQQYRQRRKKQKMEVLLDPQSLPEAPMSDRDEPENGRLPAPARKKREYEDGSTEKERKGLAMRMKEWTHKAN